MAKLKCRGCGDRFEKTSMLRLAGSNYHSFDCATAYAFEKQRKARERQYIKAQQAEKKKTGKALRDFNRKDVSWQHKQTQKAFNKMRVIEELKWFKDRGLEPECISCAKKNMDWCCGHLKTVGAQGRLRYDRKNTYLQCNRYCNMGLSGNISGNKTTRGFIPGLYERFMFKEAALIVEYLKHNSHAKKWEWQELEEMRAGFNKQIRALQG